MGNTCKHVCSSDTCEYMNGKVTGIDRFDQNGLDNSTSGRKVSFYFTNIPECLPIFLLRQQFEVCGILTNLFIARQRNACGQVYGFVRFSNVKNSDKLFQALNNVWFGHLRVWAREAKFDRFVINDRKPLVVSKSVRRHDDSVVRRMEVVRVIGEGDNTVRKHEGDAMTDWGRRWEGEKSEGWATRGES
jgi:hypothetical protein